MRQGSQLPAPHIRRRIPSTPHSPTPREEPARTTSKGRAGLHLRVSIREVALGVVYTSTKAVAQAVAQQIWTINGRFELFSSLLTNSNDL